MFPTLRNGQEVEIEKSNDIKLRDIVVYMQNGKFVIHRVIYIQNNYLITKGDYNAFNDLPICVSQVIGKVRNESTYKTDSETVIPNIPFIEVNFFSNPNEGVIDCINALNINWSVNKELVMEKGFYHIAYLSSAINPVYKPQLKHKSKIKLYYGYPICAYGNELGMYSAKLFDQIITLDDYSLLFTLSEKEQMLYLISAIRSKFTNDI